jgi:hypothetical protein
MNRALTAYLFLTAFVCGTIAVEPDYASWVKGKPVPQWVWSKEGPRSHPQIVLRKEFHLPGKVKSARLYATCDNELDLAINDQPAGATAWWYDPIETVASGLFREGKNVLTADCRDVGGAAAFVLKLEITLIDGKKILVLSDPSWQGSLAGTTEWNLKLVGHGSLGGGAWKVPFVGEGNSRQKKPARAVKKTEVASKSGLEFFERKIRPVLAEQCYGCHSASAVKSGKLKAGLQLDTREGMTLGGNRGPAIVAGKPATSLLLQAMTQGGKLKMPPKKKLPASVIKDFEKWITMGAPDPRDGKAAVVLGGAIDLVKGREHWAFKPLSQKSPPKLVADDWGRNGIDRFVQERHQKAGVKPNGTADPEVLVRRVYFDLIGLPPGPEQVAAYLAAAAVDSDKAWLGLVDGLLASKHYGERWARHWLDLSRFAESNGYAFDRDRPNAFHYRDWVIKALNADMPYDLFVKMQLAGDLSTSVNQPTSDGALQALEAHAATGYLVSGPYTTQQTAKERERSRYEQWDDMVHTIGTSLLGLTVGCARCHEHKYDPIAQTDYYRFAAIFADVGFSDTKVNLRPEAYRAAKAAYDKVHNPLVAARAKYEKAKVTPAFNKWIKSEASKPEAIALGDWQFIGPLSAKNVDDALARAFGPEQDWDVKRSYGEGKKKRSWTAQPKWEDGKARNDFKGGNSAFYLYRTIESPVAQHITLSLGADEGIKVWVNRYEVVSKKVRGPAKAGQVPVELPLKQGRNELLIKIANGGGTAGFYFKAGEHKPDRALAAILKVKPEKWNAKQRAAMLKRFKPLDPKWLKLNAAVYVDQRDHQPKPSLTPAYAAKARGSTYNFGEDRFKVYYLNRGNPDNKRGLAPAGFFPVLSTGKGDRWMKSAADKTRSPREALAEWLTDINEGAGALAARVMVNRLWKHHFGRGLVGTASDFGTRGDRPTHPELLDWLAGELIRNDWQLKSIHRLIVSSSTYLQGNNPNRQAAAIDPDNQLWWRRSARRLEAEVIRDSLLSVSGKLDSTMYGKGSLDEKSPRRSVYLTMKRSRLIPLLQLFDAPDMMQSIGKREESTVAPQALTLLNSPIIREWAGALARRVGGEPETPVDERIRKAYRLALSRSAKASEVGSMTAFIAAQTKSRGGDVKAATVAFQDFCHVLLCMNEFVYVD